MLGVATASAQFSRWIGSSVGVTLMGAIVASRLGNPTFAEAAPAALAQALHPAVAFGLLVAVLAFAAVLALPDTKLRARFDEAVVPARAR